MKKEEVSDFIEHMLKASYRFQRRGDDLFGVSWSDVLLLKYLKESGKKKVGDISGYLDIQMFKASRIVSRLAEKGYIKKVSRKDDKRALDVSITASGSKLLKKIDTHNQNRFSDYLVSFPESDARNASAYLKTLSETL